MAVTARTLPQLAATGPWHVPIATIAAAKDQPTAGGKRRKKKRRPKAAAAGAQDDEFGTPQQPSEAEDIDEGTSETPQHATSSATHLPEQGVDDDGVGPLTPEEEKIFKQMEKKLKEEAITPQEFAAYAIDKVNTMRAKEWQDNLRKGLEEHKVVYQGKRVSLRKLLERYAKEKAILDMSGYEPGMRSKEDDAQVRDALGGHDIRPGAHKMQLRPEEEALLELDLFARGVEIGPQPVVGLAFGGARKYSFGIYGRCDQAQALLEADYARKDPAKVISDPEYYEDILERAKGMELTFMAHPVMDLPVDHFRQAFLERLWVNMCFRTHIPQNPETGELVDSPELQALEQRDREALSELDCDFSTNRLQALGMVNSKGKVPAGSHWIFTWGPQDELLAEGITAGKNKDKKTVSLGVWQYPRLTRAFFDIYLGPYPVDHQAKMQTGQGILYVTNGFRFNSWDNPDNENTFYEDESGEPIFPPLARQIPTLTVDAFSFTDDAADPAPRLLSTVRSQAIIRHVGLKSRMAGSLRGIVGRFRRR